MSQFSFLPPLPEIRHHDQLPAGAKEIARVELDSGYFISLVKYQKWLIILEVDEDVAGEYLVEQIDLPLGFLNWFPQELTDYRKLPAEGGATEFHMTPGDKVVEGETLCIIRNMGNRAWPDDGPPPGYAVKNRSRNTHMDFDDYQAMSFSEQFLFEGGFLDLIRRLGAQYKAGLL